MKNKNLLNEFKPGKKMTYALPLFVALFMMAASTFGQVQLDKVRTVPTVVGDPTTEMDFGLHVTDSASSYDGRPIVLNKNGTNQIDECRNGAWAEYQVISPTGGKYLVSVAGTTKKTNASINIGAYKTETETWPETGLGDTVVVEYNNSWTATDRIYNTVVELDAGVYYTVRITFLTTDNTNNWTCNLFNGLIFKEISGSTDATLSDLKIDGATVEGFDPKTTSYSVALPPYVWINSIEAIVNDANATVEVPADLAPAEGQNTATYTIKVTSEAETTKEYKIKVVSPVLVDDGIQLKMADDVFFSNGINASNTKVNSINNGDYIDYYIYSEYDDNYLVTLNCANGYNPSTGNLNVSVLAMDDETWAPNAINTKHISTTFDDSGNSTWNSTYSVDYEYVISVKEGVPMLFRIYGTTQQSNAADIFSMTFKLLSEDIDASLSDLKVDGTSLEGFDPEILSYDVVVPVGTTSASIEATANSTKAQGIEGAGSFGIDGIKSTDTITVTSESGFAIDYYVNFYSPIELSFELVDTIPVYMASAMFNNGGARVADAKINYFHDSTYVEYYIYSATDKDVHLIANIANGNPDTISSKLNVSTYTYGTEWTLDDSYSLDVPSQGEGMWAVEYASELDFNMSLKANEAVMVRLFSITDGTLGIGDIYSLRVVEGKSGSTAVKTVENSNVNVWGTAGQLNVLCNDSFVGGSIEIYDISGRLISSESMTSTRNVYDVDRSGLYIVKVVGTDNAVHTAKCLVR